MGSSLNGVLTASTAAPLLKTSGLDVAMLRTVRSKAKGGRKENIMNKAEFMLACKYAAEVGGVIDPESSRLYSESTAAESSNV